MSIARDFIGVNPVIASAFGSDDQPALDQLNDRPGFDAQSVSGFGGGHANISVHKAQTSSIWVLSPLPMNSWWVPMNSITMSRAPRWNIITAVPLNVRPPMRMPLRVVVVIVLAFRVLLF